MWFDNDLFEVWKANTKSTSAPNTAQYLVNAKFSLLLHCFQMFLILQMYYF